jgi:hypothetical protein
MFEFLISYAWADHAWAEWIAWQLEVAGYTTRLQAWDVQRSGDPVIQMHQAVAEAARLVAVLSPPYPASVAATLELDLGRLAREPLAVDLLRLCAFLGSGPIPPGLLAAEPEVLPPELAVAVGDEPALDATIAALYRLSLLGRDHDGLKLHRLVGEVVRDGLNDQPWWAAAAVDLVAAGFPADVTEPASWPACARLLRHALATTDHADRLDVAAEQTSRLLNRVGVYLGGRSSPRRSRPSSGRCASPRRSTAPTTRPSPPTSTTSATCCGTWATWPAPAPTSNGRSPSTRPPTARTIPTSPSASTTSAR